MPKTTEKTKKSKPRTILLSIAAVIAVIALAAVIFIHIVITPTSADNEKAVAVGGLIVSDSINYQQEESNLKANPIIKVMQMVWKFCSDGDMKKHAAQTPPDNIHEVTDLAYIDDGNIYHQLDVYYPEGTTEKLPVIIDIHGGGWMYGNKELNKYYCLALASRGYVVFNINYRLVPDVTVNEQLQDCAYALKWISENMQDYPCDTENILLTGDSAGGQLAVYSAALLQSEKLREVFDVVDGDLQPSALLLTSPVSYMNDGSAFSMYTKILWGRDYKDKATYEYMNLDQIIDYVQLPPTYLITSSGDTLAHSQTLKAAELLESKGVQTELVDYGKVDGKKQVHVFSVLYPFDTAGVTAIDEALAFFEKTINNKVTN
ncbi:MAG: alpha/beta hydrolase [Eubacterium sp.]|nr:alpha/beta hydrolase [Eubacterium sp.]